MTLDLFNTGDDPNDVDEPSDVEPIGQPVADQSNPSPAATAPNTAAQLQAIIARHKAAYDGRTYDFALRGEPVKLARGTPEHAAVFGRRQPQWHHHIALGPTGRKANIIDLIRSEAHDLLGWQAEAAVDALL